MIFDREENEAVRVLLEERFIGFFGLDCWRNDRSSYRFLVHLDGFEKRVLDVEVVDGWSVLCYVLFPNSFEAEFLSWRVHLEVLNSRGSLSRECVSIDGEVGYKHSVARDRIPSLKA